MTRASFRTCSETRRGGQAMERELGGWEMSGRGHVRTHVDGEENNPHAFPSGLLFSFPPLARASLEGGKCAVR